MKQQTALDWFVKEIQTRLINDGEVNYVELAKEAKAIEKGQILMARLNGFKISAEGWNAEWPFEGIDDSIISKDIENEQYYIQTYQ